MRSYVVDRTYIPLRLQYLPWSWKAAPLPWKPSPPGKTAETSEILMCNNTAK